MAIFKRKRTKAGKTTEDASYTIQFADHNGITRRLPAFEIKRASEALLNRIETLISFRTAQQQPDNEYQRFIDTLPAGIVCKLVAWDIVTGGRQSAGVLVADHVKDFEQSLTDKGFTKKHITATVPRIQRIVTDCKIVSIQDININPIQRYVSGLQQISDQTRKYYIRNMKQFSKWLFDTGRTSADMLSRLDMPQVNEIMHQRRALTADEAARLLQAAKSSGIVFQGISGYERYLIYSLALNTGLRANEIRTLTVSDFNFVGAAVSIKPRNEKNRKGTTLPLQQDISEAIRAFTAGKLPMAKAFKMPCDKTAKMLRIDLKAAGIEYQTDAGFADFHALRHTFGTMLAKAGVTPQISQRLMRHSDPKLTMNIYSHLLVADLRDGTDKLPDYSQIREKQAATGTADNAPEIRDTPRDTLSAQNGDNLRPLATNKPVCTGIVLNAKNPVLDTKNSVLDTENRASCSMKVLGFEPKTYGLKGRCSTC